MVKMKIQKDVKRRHKNKIRENLVGVPVKDNFQ